MVNWRISVKGWQKIQHEKNEKGLRINWQGSFSDYFKIKVIKIYALYFTGFFIHEDKSFVKDMLHEMILIAAFQHKIAVLKIQILQHCCKNFKSCVKNPFVQHK